MTVHSDLSVREREREKETGREGERAELRGNSRLGWGIRSLQFWYLSLAQETGSRHLLPPWGQPAHSPGVSMCAPPAPVWGQSSGYSWQGPLRSCAGGGLPSNEQGQASRALWRPGVWAHTGWGATGCPVAAWPWILSCPLSLQLGPVISGPRSKDRPGPYDGWGDTAREGKAMSCFPIWCGLHTLKSPLPAWHFLGFLLFCSLHSSLFFLSHFVFSAP